jgi:hypothetical protein
VDNRQPRLQHRASHLPTAEAPLRSIRSQFTSDGHRM